ncbi:ankyrin and het domain protein [Paraphaeosphaeria sporulosa]
MDIYAKLSPLQDSQIRLLHVSPCSDPSEICCVLTVVSLRSQPSYSALSYTWGSPFPDYSERHDKSTDPTITCNGIKISVKSNLHDFLLHCATHSDPAFRGLLWVDALCINQGCHPERTKQVQLIGDIYKHAERVVVWLGVEDDATAMAVELMKRFAALNPAARSARVLQSRFSPASQDPLFDPRHWHAMARFFERNWFERAWIIQEITFARWAIVLCGQHTLKWDEITTMSKFMATDFSATSIWSKYFEIAANTDVEFAVSVRARRANFPAKLAATKANQLSSSGDGLLYALIRSRVSKCQDARDKVYSQLRLGTADIIPTYEKDVAQVYITAATYILQNSDNLLLLTCVEGSDFQNISNLPSWVPDWSVTKDLGLRITGYRQFKAAGNLPRTAKVVNGGRVLQIQAARIDIITKSAETKAEILDFSRPTRLWEMLAELDDIYAPTEETKEEALWRTLITNRAHVDGAIQYPASISPVQESFVKWIISRYFTAIRKSPLLESSSFPVFESSGSIVPSRKAILEIVENASPEDRAAVEKEASIFHSHYSHAMFVRPFRTQQGFLGLGTQSLSEGDSVWIVAGCRVPLILRKVEDSLRYKLVGGTLLHGFMDGQWLRRDGVRFNVVELE